LLIHCNRVNYWNRLIFLAFAPSISPYLTRLAAFLCHPNYRRPHRTHYCYHQHRRSRFHNHFIMVLCPPSFLLMSRSNLFMYWRTRSIAFDRLLRGRSTHPICSRCPDICCGYCPVLPSSATGWEQPLLRLCHPGWSRFDN
jgi:hypothetical protein